MASACSLATQIGIGPPLDHRPRTTDHGATRRALSAPVAIAQTVTSASLGSGVVVYRRTHSLDAIHEYSQRLAGAIAEAGQNVTYVPEGLGALRRSADRPDWILLNYMPFSYGRWGFAPGLIRDVIAIRRARRVLLGVMVHEAWVPMEDWRTCLMGAYQRVQLRLLLRLSDVVLVSTEDLLDDIGGSAVHLPVGSNISVTVTSRAAARRALAIPDEELVIALFGTSNPHRTLEHAEAALEALVAARGCASLRVLNLGAQAAPLRVPTGLRVDTPGFLLAEDVSLRLSASNVLLMTFTDGVSTRRGSVMAGLAHGVPVVGLLGHATDSLLLRHPDALVLTPVGDLRAFSNALVEIAGEPERLERGGKAARALYTQCFDWPVVARRLLTALHDGGPGSVPRVPRRGPRG